MLKFLHGKKIVLASTSPRRKSILEEQLGLSFDVFESEVDERNISEGIEDPSVMVKLLAESKAKHALANYSKAHSYLPDLLIASDTVTALDGIIIGKPSGKAEARKTLTSLSGRVHSVYTGVCFYYRKESDQELQAVSFVESSKVRFGDISAETIEDYLETGESYDKAGAYGTQGFGSTLIESIEGDFYTIVGFPVHRFYLKVREAFLC